METSGMGILIAIVSRGGPLAAQRLLGWEDERTKLLRRIEKKVDASLESWYNAGIIHMQEAAAPGRSQAAQKDSLRLARENFIHAAVIFQEVDPLRSSWAAVYVSGIGKMANSREDTMSWMMRAHDYAVKAVELRCAEINDRTDGLIGRKIRLTSDKTMMVISATSASLVTAALPAVAPVLAAAGGVYAYRVYRAKQGRAQLEELHTYVCQLRKAASMLNAEVVADYQLTFDKNARKYSYGRIS